MKGGGQEHFFCCQNTVAYLGLKTLYGFVLLDVLRADRTYNSYLRLLRREFFRLDTTKSLTSSRADILMTSLTTVYASNAQLIKKQFLILLLAGDSVTAISNSVNAKVRDLLFMR